MLRGVMGYFGINWWWRGALEVVKVKVEVMGLGWARVLGWVRVVRMLLPLWGLLRIATIAATVARTREDARRLTWLGPGVSEEVLGLIPCRRLDVPSGTGERVGMCDKQSVFVSGRAMVLLETEEWLS